MASDGPLISLCMIVRNGMPYVVEALESVQMQTYQNIELIVQDCCSTDGTLEHIRKFAESVSFPVRLVSEKDGGIADAINRALARCTGSIIAFVDADNLLLPEHIQTGVQFFAQHPDVTVAYTAFRTIDNQGRTLHDWMPPEYDFVKMLECEIAAASASMMIQRHLAGDDLRYDTTPELGHYPDREFWVRIGYHGHRIERIPEVTYCTRVSDKSGSWNVHHFDKHVASLIFAVERFFTTYDLSRWPEASLPRAKAGIYIWAAQSIQGLEGRSVRFHQYCERAAALYPHSEQLKRLMEQKRFWQKWIFKRN